MTTAALTPAHTVATVTAAHEAMRATFGGTGCFICEIDHGEGCACRCEVPAPITPAEVQQQLAGYSRRCDRVIAIARRVYKAGPDGPEAAARVLRDALRNTTTQAQVDAICALHADYLRWHDRIEAAAYVPGCTVKAPIALV